MTKQKTRHRTGSAETINPDHIGMHRGVVFGVVVTLLAAVATSWNGLIYVAEAQLLPDEVRFLTPIMIDVPLIVLTLARGALRKRGIRATGLLWGIVGLTVFSSAANALHTVAEAGFETIPAIVGTLTNALAPWLILSMTEVLWLVVTRPIRPRAARSKTKAATRRSSRSPRPAPPKPAPPTLFEHDPLGALRESAQ